ncbi:MAG TPA: transglycosylase SLT domain-containing protein [Methylomirabilota bacterium]
MISLLRSIAVTAVIATASPAAAEVFRLKAADGTVHFTNAPTDPQYRRMEGSVTTGSEAGWLRLPKGDTRPYLNEILEASSRYGVPDQLVTAVIRAESGFNPRAVSRKGAQGLMQLMPATASNLGVRNSFDPRENIQGGVRHLRGLIDRFPGNLPLAIAAYNAGEKAVLTYGGIPPYPETQDYVGKVLRYYGMPVGGVTFPTQVFQTISRDGTVTYSNIPPRGRR